MSRAAHHDRAPGLLNPAAVRVPASTSNLGAGFDCVGLALDRFLDVTFEPTGEGLTVVRDDGHDSHAGEDLIAAAFRQSLAGRGITPVGCLHVRSTIPVSRGLGSSAAALVAGTALAARVAGEPIDPDAAFALAARSEGHGDNAAPSAYGGLVAVVSMDGITRVLPHELSPVLGFAFAAPPTRVATRDARTALPETVPHGVAAAALSRLAALLRGLASGDPDLLRLGFDDALHVPHRLRLIPGGQAALDAARRAGAWGATVSGSGSGLLAVGPLDAAPDLADAMRRPLVERHGQDGVEAYPVRPVDRGVHAV